MTRPRTKKSESIEVRLSHEVKQAFMDKAAADGASASDIVRQSIADYLHGRTDVGRKPARLWTHAAAFAAAGMALLFAYSISSPASADRRALEAAKARLAFDHTDLAGRKALAKKFAKEFAGQRLYVARLDPEPTERSRATFVILDGDSDGRLSLNEYRQLVNVPSGDAGRKLFNAKDSNHDGWLSEQEFRQ